jgi:hypothetical protein
MRTALATAAAVATACAGADHRIVQPDQRSFAQHMLDAEEHDRRAADQEQQASTSRDSRGPTNYTCGDTVLNDQLTTGGTKVTTWQPCFDLAEEAAVEHRDAAAHERELARRDRRTATALVVAEDKACEGIPRTEREHSLFAHRKLIIAVTPHRESEQVRGAWIQLKRVPGLDAMWVRRDIMCQRARFAVIGPTAAFDDDPTLLPGSTVHVYGHDDRIDVLVTTDTTPDGELALARAMGDLRATTQTAVKE